MFKVEKLETDILVIGGGAAGLFGSIEASEKMRILIVDKAYMKRSGCLAAGVNALNAYLDKQDLVDDYIDNISEEFNGIVREDLAKTIGENLNKVTKSIEKMGLTILKDKDGNYIKRGKRSIKMNGENIKEVLFKKAREKKNITLLNHVNIIDYIVKDGEVIGAIGLGVKEKTIYMIYSKKTLCSTGGASGLYKGNSDGLGRHKSWYSPFNTGAGLAMGIRVGAEMTSFEMRFVALRIKNTIAPTGTIAQGINGKMINNLKKEYEKNYKGPKTVKRLYGSVIEGKEGRGPCFIKTEGIDNKTEEELNKAYLNMAPIQVLYWKENKIDIKKDNVEIEGTEPYIVGGHSICGYYVDTERRTNINGLYAAGDVVGGVGKKYVTGAFVEGEIAFKTMEKDMIKENIFLDEKEENELINKIEKRFLEGVSVKIEDLENQMQEAMEQYCGGKRVSYGYTEKGLDKGEIIIKNILNETNKIKVKNPHEFLFLRELIDRLYVCVVLINHMRARKETRINIYNENLSYKKIDKTLECYINSIYKEGEVYIKKRNIVKRGERLEYKNR